MNDFGWEKKIFRELGNSDPSNLAMKKMSRRRNRERSRRGTKPMIREVWGWNFDAEICRLDECLEFHSTLSIDTEFPGCIRSSPWGSTDAKVYEDLRLNVNQTKLIQLGLTASDDYGNMGGSWEFNFSDFDPEVDAHNPSSILFLRQNGLDFQKLKRHGIPFAKFTSSFLHVIRKNRIFKWITFHGLYDIGYLMKAMAVMQALPATMEEFATAVARIVGVVRDLKHMARFCEGLEGGKLGLERMGELLDQKRCGMKHHAGSDSLLTACLHVEMMRRFEVDSKFCDGYLYGLSIKLQFMADVKVTNAIRFGQFSYALPLRYAPSYITYNLSNTFSAQISLLHKSYSA